MARAIFTGPTPPAGPSGLEQSLAGAGQGFGQGFGQGMNDVFTGRRRGRFLESMAPEGGFGEGDPRARVLDTLGQNPAILADENMFNQMMSMLTPQPDLPIVRAVEAAGLQRGTPDFQQAVLRGSGALESTPEFIRMQDSYDQAVAAGDTRRASMIQRRLEHMAGDLERARIAEARAGRAQAAATAGREDRGDQRDRRIAALYDQYQRRGMPDQEAWDMAVNVADRNIDLQLDNEGRVVLMDRVGQESREIPQQLAQDIVHGAEEAERRLAEMPTIVEQATNVAGVGPAARRTSERVLGQFGFSTPSGRDAVRAAQLAAGETARLIQPFFNNPRFSDSERQFLLDTVGSLTPQLIDSEPAFIERAEAIDQSLARAEAHARIDLAAPGMSPKGRREVEQTMRDIRQARSRLGVDKMAAQTTAAPPPPPPDAPPQGSGFSPAEWGALTPEERQEVMELLP